jgi:hypothetical protein
VGTGGDPTGSGSVTSGEDERLEQLTRLFTRRRGWRLRTPITPGLRPAWCYLVGRDVRLSVAADDAGYSVYLTEEDRELTFGDLASLATWLDGKLAELG